MGTIRSTALILSFLNAPRTGVVQVKERGREGKPNQGLRQRRLSRYGPATHNRANN
jgi:hypothetical protein